MNLPHQVQLQAEQVEQFDAELMKAQEPAQPPVDDPPQPAPEPEPPADPAPTPAPEPKQPNWELKYKSLQGMFDAEVPRLQSQVKRLTRELDDLKATKAAAAEPPKPKITPEDINNFGSDMLDVVRRQAEEVAEAKLSVLQQELDKLREANLNLAAQLDGVQETTTQVTQRSLFERLTDKVPNWEAVNADQGFLDWLAEADPLSGVPRQAYLDDAQTKGDVDRVARLFTTWEDANRPPTPAVQPKPAAPAIERQIQPGSGHASAAPPAQDNGIWTSSQIDAFYRAVARGDYSSNPDEQVRVANEIDRAISEGRVRL